MHLQTLATTINQSSIGKGRLPLTMLHHIPRPFGLGIFCCHSPARKQQTGNFTLSGVFFPWRVWYTRFSATNRNWEARIMWNELGISGGTAIIILIALYYVIKWAVRNGIKEAYRAITGEKTDEDIQNEEELKEREEYENTRG